MFVYVQCASTRLLSDCRIVAHFLYDRNKVDRGIQLSALLQPSKPSSSSSPSLNVTESNHEAEVLYDLDELLGSSNDRGVYALWISSSSRVESRSTDRCRSMQTACAPWPRRC